MERDRDGVSSLAYPSWKTYGGLPGHAGSETSSPHRGWLGRMEEVAILLDALRRRKRRDPCKGVQLSQSRHQPASARRLSHRAYSSTIGSEVCCSSCHFSPQQIDRRHLRRQLLSPGTFVTPDPEVPAITTSSSTTVR